MPRVRNGFSFGTEAAISDGLVGRHVTVIASLMFSFKLFDPIFVRSRHGALGFGCYSHHRFRRKVRLVKICYRPRSRPLAYQQRFELSCPFIIGLSFFAAVCKTRPYLFSNSHGAP